RLVAYLQDAGGLRAVPVDPLEGLRDHHALGVTRRLARDHLQAEVWIHRPGRRGRDDRTRHRARHGAARVVMAEVDGAEHDGALDGVLELPDVARPRLL